uniref:Uncharacterized protein n=1 Tax=Rhodopseudomonas palustris (strain DX-1) TaxID=652103 RepID=E6VN07_RHOPX
MKLTLLQNCIEPQHRNMIQKGFDAFDFCHNPRPELREFQIFKELFESGEYKKSDILGAVSIRFQGKSLLDGDDVRAWIGENPGYDVYVVNPYPQFVYTHKNLWQFSESTRDPDFTRKSQAVFDKVGIKVDLARTGHQTADVLSTCSYWFGSPAFWSAYMEDVVLPVLDAGRDLLGDDLYNFLYEPQFYYGRAIRSCGSLPFLLERSLSMYIANSPGIKSKFFPAPRERVLACCLFNFEKELVHLFGDMIDRWDAENYQGEAMEDYFAMASRMCGAGWRLYFKYHPISFEAEDVRSSKPWHDCLSPPRHNLQATK